MSSWMLTGSITLFQAVAVDSEDSIYLTGFTEEHLAGNINAGKTDIFLVKYDTEGKESE